MKSLEGFLRLFDQQSDDEDEEIDFESKQAIYDLTPIVEIGSRKGPAHNPRFTAHCRIKNLTVAAEAAQLKVYMYIYFKF